MDPKCLCSLFVQIFFEQFQGHLYLFYYQQLVIRMQHRNNIKIDESIKVNSWGEESPINSPLAQQQHYLKYAAGKEDYNQNESLRNTPFFQSQATELANMEQGFRRIKNEQMEKLKNLKSQYEEIRKITTDYEGPRIVEHSSLRSSRQMNQPQLISAQNSKNKINEYGFPGREAQILQLQKKQLQIMIENSMKKIQELLHNEMEYKRTIHELRINQDTKNSLDSDSSTLNKAMKKKEKDFAEQVRSFELQRQNLLSTVSTLKDKIKYLQSNLLNSEQELRKMLEEKRNYQQIIRMEKDKFLNLEIQFRREKREHQIIQKDKEAQINHLLKLKDVKEAASEKELKAMVTSLQQQVKVKEKRYTLLLQQFENFKKEKTKEEKDQEAKIVTELLSKTVPQQNPNKVMQETIGSILQRLTELQTKPKPQKNLQLFETIIKENSKDNQVQELFYEIQTLKDKIRQYITRIGNLESSYREQTEENNKLRLQNDNLRNKYKSASVAQKSLQEEVQILKEQLRTTKMENKEVNKIVKLPKPTVQPSDQSATTAYLNSKIHKLEAEIEYLNKELKETRSEREKVEDQSRNQLLQISKLEFEIEKTKKQGQFQLEMAQKSHQTYLNNVVGDINYYKQLFNKSNYQVGQLKTQLQLSNDSFKAETFRFKSIIQSLQKDKNVFDTDMKRAYNERLQKIKTEHTAQIEELTSSIQNITSLNRRLQEELHKNRLLEDENHELRQFIKASRPNPNQNSAVRTNKQKEFMNAAMMLSGVRLQ